MGRGVHNEIQRRRRRSFAAAALVFVFLWMGFGTLFAGNGPSMTLTPNHGLRGSSVHLIGDFTPPGSGIFDNAYVYWDWTDDVSRGRELTNSDTRPPVDNNGRFTFDFTVPVDYSPGTYTVHACTQDTSTDGPPPCVENVETTFTIPVPTVVLQRNHGRAGESRNAHGRGFLPYCNSCEQYPTLSMEFDPTGADVYLDPPGYFSQGDTTPPGKFDQTWFVPSLPFGTYDVLACDTFKGCRTRDQATAQFTITYPRISLSKHEGLAGDVIQVSGSGMYATRPVRIFFGPKADPFAFEYFAAANPVKQTNANGAYGPLNINVPASFQPGFYRVTACTREPLRSGGFGECSPFGDPNSGSFDANSPAFDSPHTGFTILAPPTPTPEVTPAPTPRPTATPNPTARPTAQPTANPTPRPTPRPTPVPTPEPTASPEPSPSPEPPNPSPEPSATPEVTAEPVVTPEPTPSPEITPEPTATPEVTAEPVVTAPPTIAPTTQPTAAAPVFWPQSLRDPGHDNSLGNLGAIGGSALLALLVAFLIPFPGTLFNKTVEANYAEIQGWFARLRNGWTRIVRTVAIGPLGPLVGWFGRAMSGGTGVWLFLLLTSLVYGFLSPAFGLNYNSLVLFLGLLVGLAFITAAFDLPLRAYHRRRTKAQDAGVLRALWWTLLIAIICVVISRLAGFQPGYLYGLIISIVFVTEISIRDEGLGTWLASVWLLVLSFVAWALLGLVRGLGGDATLQLFIQTVLATFVVAGIEALVIGLLPMRFLPGHPLFEWRKSFWFPLFALSVFGYLLILVDPANGYLSDDSKTPMLVGIVFLVGFGIVSFGTWAYFRYRPARLGGDRPGEAPEPPGEPAA